MPENEPKQVRLQKDIERLAVEAGFVPTFTCAPYLVGNVPLRGEVYAWTTKPSTFAPRWPPQAA